MGPLATIFALLKQEENDRRFGGMYQPPVREHQGLLEDRPLPPGLGPRPYRDPMQSGPEPPPPLILARMYGGR